MLMTNFKESSIYRNSALRGCHSYVLPHILRLCAGLKPNSRVLDIGCGNGSLTREFAKMGNKVTGVDLSRVGIEIARNSCQEGRFEVVAADNRILDELDEAPFDLVYSVEVIEHLYDPRSFLEGCFLATKSEGIFLCSTPYHGYIKNLAISLTNGWDGHADPLDDGGHIKFYSEKTLKTSVEEAGFVRPKIVGAGRIPLLWKSMILTATKPV
jgi:2-polyprenyl-3-methyl-5-hydroxy-6-metoxy-1,4-benzoquinol methylase